MEELEEKLSGIGDFRNKGYVKRPLINILIIVMCATMCGLDSLCQIVEYANNKKEFLKIYFGINEIPSKTTFCRVLKMINGDEVVKVIIDIMKDMVDEKGQIVAVDGKAIRKTHKENYTKSALQILTAYCTDSGVVLGQEMITSKDKTNEISVFQEMLGYMDISNKIITADAMHTQKTTCQMIIKGSGDYILCLKENRKNFFKEVEKFFADKNNKNITKSKTIVEENKGRTEKRTCYKAKDISVFSYTNEWDGLKTIFAIVREITTKKGTSVETSYYISSCTNPAIVLLKNTRKHWKVESMHWMLDVVFNEDDSLFYSENSYNILNIFRKFSLLLHKNYVSSLPKKNSLKSNMFNCLLTDSTLLDVLFF